MRRVRIRRRSIWACFALALLLTPVAAPAAPGPRIADRNAYEIARLGAILPNHLPVPPSPIPNPNAVWTPLVNDINAPLTQTTILILPGQDQDLVFDVASANGVAHLYWKVYPFDITAQFTGRVPGPLRTGDACVPGATNICLGNNAITLHIKPHMSFVGTLGANIPGPGYYGLLLIAKDEMGNGADLTRTFLIFPGATSTPLPPIPRLP